MTSSFAITSQTQGHDSFTNHGSQGGRKAIDIAAHPDLTSFFQIRPHYRAEIDSLYRAAAATFLDDTNLASRDPKLRAANERGTTPTVYPGLCGPINSVIDGRPDLTVSASVPGNLCAWSLRQLRRRRSALQRAERRR